MSFDRLAVIAARIIETGKLEENQGKIREILSLIENGGISNEYYKKQVDEISINLRNIRSETRIGSQFYLFEKIDYKYFTDGELINELNRNALIYRIEGDKVAAARLTIILDSYEFHYNKLSQLSTIGSPFADDPLNPGDAEIGFQWASGKEGYDLQEFRKNVEFTNSFLNAVSLHVNNEPAKARVTGLANLDPFVTIGASAAVIAAAAAAVKGVMECVEKFYSIQKIRSEARKSGIEAQFQELILERETAAKDEAVERVTERLAPHAHPDAGPETAAKLARALEQLVDQVSLGARIGVSFDTDEPSDDTADGFSPEKPEATRKLFDEALTAQMESPFSLPKIEENTLLLESDAREGESG